MFVHQELDASVAVELAQDRRRNSTSHLMIATDGTEERRREHGRVASLLPYLACVHTGPKELE
jgi:hypothetical protein